MDSSHLLRELSPWTTYEVRVLGYNADGAGPASASVEAKTLAAGKLIVLSESSVPCLQNIVGIL